MVDLINQILMERILPSSTCDTRMSIDSSTIAEETSQMVINDGIVNNSSSPSSLFGTSPGKVCGNSKNKSGILVTQDDCLQYLMESYERVSAAEKKYPKVWVYTFSSFFPFFVFWIVECLLTLFCFIEITRCRMEEPVIPISTTVYIIFCSCITRGSNIISGVCILAVG